MNENKDSHQPVGLVLLLIYQWLLVMGSLACVGVAIVTTWRDWRIDRLEDYLSALVLACWGIALAVASIGITRRRPRGFLLGMICHLILEIPALPMMLFVFGTSVYSLLFGSSGFERGLAWVFLLCALVWLPFVLISGWAFFYLRRLRKSLLAQGPQNVAGLMP